MIKLNFVLYLSLLCGFCVSIPGGVTPITDESTLTELRNKFTIHLKKLNAQENGAQLEFVKLHQATVQVIAGLLYKMNVELNENNINVNCAASLLEQQWTNFVEFDVECGSDDERKRKYGWSSDQTETTIEQLLKTGGFSPLNKKSLAGLHPKLTHSFIELGKIHKEFDLTVKRILSGKSQVVAGTRYMIAVEAANPNNEVITCEADIWEKTWENFFQIKLTCQGKSYEIIFN
ncbi:uncharacterized protein LOC129565908 [Sitodiplosis mosellana]|uniref:uncharacterized protein LOC129565908 n=1 Tax=Sitodiplosis mosellana TaxID=263140 RepID=UPI0024442098|nr:uncharacterized protein LOC129565908 [Sitodiplosis mosellana]